MFLETRQRQTGWFNAAPVVGFRPFRLARRRAKSSGLRWRLAASVLENVSETAPMFPAFPFPLNPAVSGP